MSGMCELVEIGCLTSGDARRNVRGDQCDLSRGNIIRGVIPDILTFCYNSMAICEAARY